ncbi:hypothetical protein HY095_05995 [Candidatus Micrarchaeota archaeon]|nr:hypothetical protein [Candidatus Micrarchaeota archaeon]
MPPILCDSSSLISLSMSCNAGAIGFLHSQSPRVRFAITPKVMGEIVERPIQIRRFEYSAIRLNQLVAEKKLAVLNPPALAKTAAQLESIANDCFTAGKMPLAILQAGELEILAAAMLSGSSAVVVDEKTTRLLCENPGALRERLSQEYEAGVGMDDALVGEFQSKTRGISFIRSCELLCIAAKKGFFSKYGKLQNEAFHSALYSLKAAGCSLTDGELREYEAIRV